MEENPSCTLLWLFQWIKSLRSWFQLFRWNIALAVPYLSQYSRESPIGTCGGVWKTFLVFKCCFWIKKGKTTGFFNGISKSNFLRYGEQFVIFKPLSSCFKETLGFDVKALLASPPLSRLIRWYNRPGG